jgi:hypothetical protein
VRLGLLAKIWSESWVSKDLLLDMNLIHMSSQGQYYTLFLPVYYAYFFCSADPQIRSKLYVRQIGVSLYMNIQAHF